MSRYLARVIDTETGGFDPAKNALIEIGWGYLTEDLKVERAQSIHILPQEGRTIEPGAIEINGYTAELWDEYGAVPLEGAIATIMAEWAQHPPLAHAGSNCSFDRRFLAAYAPQLVEPRFITDVVIDTQTGGRALWRAEGVTKPPKGGLSLTGLLVKCGYQRMAAEAHGALEDVIATGQLLRLLREKRAW